MTVCGNCNCKLVDKSYDCHHSFCCRSWEEERSSLTSQIKALRREARLYTSSRKGKAARHSNGADAGAGAAGAGSDAASVDEDDANPEVQLAALRRALDEAKENEVCVLSVTNQRCDY
jgi:hypothetical protein